MMPSTCYSQIIAELARVATVVCYDGATPLGGSDVARIAQEVSVTSMGYFGHSSLDPDLFACPALDALVLCDPATLPIGLDADAKRLTPRSIRSAAPVMSIRTEFTLHSPVPFVPRPFTPWMALAEVIEYKL